MNTDPEKLRQLQAYVRASFAQRVDEQTLRATLLQAGWDGAVVEKAITKARPSPHQVRNAVLWIVSPLILFAVDAIISLSLSAMHIQGAGVNIFSILIGLIAGLLVIVGPVVGIIMLARR